MNRKLIYIFCLLIIVFSTITSISAGNLISSVASPNGQLKVELILSADSLSYQVSKNDQLIIRESRLGINVGSNNFSQNLNFKSSAENSVDESYQLPSGKMSTYRNNYKELTCNFEQLSTPMQIIFRVYDDGFAFRYVLSNGTTINVQSELSKVVVNDFKYSWSQKYRTDYSTYYEKRDWSQNINTDSGYEFCAPVFVQAQNTYLLLTEAANYSTYSASKIKANQQTGCYSFEPIGSISSSAPLETPWRVVIIGDIPTIMESTMVENLNPPTDLADVSWIKPGRSSWDWGGEDAVNSVGFEIAKRYIDFAHDMGWEYFTLDDGWDSSSADFTLQQVVDYATSKQVGVIVWTHQNRFSNSRIQIHEILTGWKNIGVKGIKVDFFEDDSQTMMRKYDFLLDEAGKLQLLVNLHGCTKPSGIRRKWPHLLTSEAVLGGEMYLFNSTMTPAYHNINLTMTRNVIGPMDYTPGDFGTKTGLIRQFTTWSHQMALLTAFESGIQCYIDCPQNYKYHIAESFFKRLPVAWDETKVIEAAPDSYSTIARRRGEDWYVASLCYQQRNLVLPLSFLTAGTTYYAYIYKDGDCKSEIQFEYRSDLTSNDVLNIPMLESGGVTIQLSTSPDLTKPDVCKYEAESSDNRTFGTKTTDADGLCSGLKYVSNLGRGNYLRFQKIEVEQDGEYEMTIYYMTGEDRDSYIKVNDGSELFYSYNKTGGWSGNNLGFMTVLLDLKAGTNIIEFGNKDAFMPNIDRIEVKPTQTYLSIDQNQLSGGIEVTSLEREILIRTQNSGIVTVYNLVGEKMMSQQIDAGLNTISLNNTGIYIVHVRVGRESFSSKIIIK